MLVQVRPQRSRGRLDIRSRGRLDKSIADAGAGAPRPPSPHMRPPARIRCLTTSRACLGPVIPPQAAHVLRLRSFRFRQSVALEVVPPKAARAARDSAARMLRRAPAAPAGEGDGHYRGLHKHIAAFCAQHTAHRAQRTGHSPMHSAPVHTSSYPG